MNIAAILPCRGRAEQTVANVRRLLATAGDVHWRLWCVVSNVRDPGLATALDTATDHRARIAWLPEFTYWKGLAYVCNQIDTEATHIANLANDLIPGMHWLRRAADAYRQAFGDGPGLLGFNGDSHEVGHSCHFLISRSLLEHYGGWPVWYDHNFGDTELCQRAITDGVYAKAPWALLFHDHPYFGGQDDAVYAEGRAQAGRDEQLYHERRRTGWPPISRDAITSSDLARATSAVRG